MAKFKIDEAGNKYQLDRETGEWVLIDGVPVEQEPDAATDDEADED